MIALTKQDGQLIWLASNHILALEPCVIGTLVHYSHNRCVTVREKPLDILKDLGCSQEK